MLIKKRKTLISLYFPINSYNLQATASAADPSGIRRIDVWIQSALVFSVSSAGQTFKQDFQLTQWNRKDGRHSCKDCVEKKKKEGTPYECMQCHFWKVEEAFEAESIGYRHFRRICKDCEEKSLCRGECVRGHRSCALARSRMCEVAGR